MQIMSYKLHFIGSKKYSNKIRDLFKVKLHTIKSETKKEREKKKERVRLEIFINPKTDRGVIGDPN